MDDKLQVGNDGMNKPDTDTLGRNNQNKNNLNQNNNNNDNNNTNDNNNDNNDDNNNVAEENKVEEKNVPEENTQQEEQQDTPSDPPVPVKDNTKKPASQGNKKSQEQVDAEVDDIVKNLQDQIEALEIEKDAQSAAAKEAKRLLDIKIAEEEQRAKDWEQKQKQLQEAQKLAQKLLIEKEEEQAKELAKFSNCEELNAECTNLRSVFRSLRDATNLVKESFGHELVEVQYLFNQKLRELGTTVTPVTQHTNSIE